MNRHSISLMVAALFVMTAAHAETITFDADGEVVFVRAYDQFGTAVVEFIGEPGAFYQCIVMNADDKPLATSPVMSDLGQAMFEGISAADIATFVCRRTM